MNCICLVLNLNYDNSCFIFSRFVIFICFEYTAVSLMGQIQENLMNYDDSVLCPRMCSLTFLVPRRHKSSNVHIHFNQHFFLLLLCVVCYDFLFSFLAWGQKYSNTSILLGKLAKFKIYETPKH